MEKKGDIKAFDQINRIKKIAKFGIPQWSESPTAAVKIFFSGKGAVAFVSAGVLKEFRTITTTLYIKNKTIQKNYTLDNFIKDLVSLLRLLHKEQREANNKDWDALISELTERQDVEIEIAFPIYGVLFHPFRVSNYLSRRCV